MRVLELYSAHAAYTNILDSFIKTVYDTTLEENMRQAIFFCLLAFHTKI